MVEPKQTGSNVTQHKNWFGPCFGLSGIVSPSHLCTCFKVKLRSDYGSFEILPDFEIRLHTVSFVQITNRSGRSYKKWSKWLNLSSCAALRCQLRELNRIKRKETSLSSISAAQSTCTGWVLRINQYCCSPSPTLISLGNHK